MNFGVGLHADTEMARFAALAHAIESAGFARLWVPDERFQRDIAAALTVAATVTKSIRIGTAVTDPFIRHPALTASILASADEVAEGRMTAGIGAGISGFSALGVRRERPRLALREAITLMRRLWSGETVNFVGETTSFRDGRLEYVPLREDVPVWIAGRGPAVLALAGEIGDGVILGSLASEGGIAYARKHVGRGVRLRKRQDRPTWGIWLHTAISEDAEAARRAVRPIVTGVLISSRTVLDELGVSLPNAFAKALDGVAYGMGNPEMLRVSRDLPDTVLDAFSVSGDRRQVRARLEELGRLGIEHVSFVPWLVPGQSFERFLDEAAAALPA